MDQHMLADAEPATGVAAGRGIAVRGEPGRHAKAAAESVRALNHLTLPGAGGLAEPADAYDVLGALASLASRLPQALGQLQVFLDTECSAGRVRIVDGEHVGDPAAVAAAAAEQLAAAIRATDALHASLDAAYNILSWAAAAR